jgi:glycerophosphoryl diester phosphodiesterase
MLVLAHRGNHNSAPPNTYAAFDSAVNMGLDGIETDVRISRDGVLILFHDRCAPGGKPVSSITHRELETLVGYSVPTLEGAIATWSNVLWNLEIKTAATANASLGVITRYRTRRRFLITSFIHPIVQEFVQRADIEGGLLIAHQPLASVSPAVWISSDPRINTIVCDYETCSDGSIASALAVGLRIFVYGAITREEHRGLVQWNVNAAITDYPQYLLDD